MEAIKIEDPQGGDPYCAFLSMGVGAAQASTVHCSFESDNRNKKSITVDVRTKEGQEIVYRLVEKADVFLTNLPPAALERFGMTYPALKARNPRLIYVGVRGYGPVGPERGRAAFDYAGFWARASMMATMGKPDAPLPEQRPAMGDHTSAIAVAGATAALFARERTGQRQEVQLSLYRTGMWVNSMDMQMALITRQNVPVIMASSCVNPGGNKGTSPRLPGTQEN